MVAGRKSKKQDDSTATVDPPLEMNPSTMLNFTEYVPDPDHLLEVRTEYGNIFKSLLDTLKAVLNDANIVFTSEGLKIVSVDSHKHALVHLFMDAEKFEFFHCKEKLVLGVDIDLLYRTIKTNKMNDLMCLVVHKDKKDVLKISFENEQKKTCVRDEISLLNLKEFNISSEALEYPRVSKMDSQLFQNICREISGFQATFLEIRNEGDKLVFTNKNGTTMRTVEVGIGSSVDLDGNIRYAISPPAQESVGGIFSLRFLKSFAKAANLCPEVKIYLKKDAPLICEYAVANLGSLKYLLSPVTESQIRQANA
jgi:proliferating cell nuclear antigen